MKNEWGVAKQKIVDICFIEDSIVITMVMQMQTEFHNGK